MKKLLLCVAVAALATTANAQTTTLADKNVKVIGDGVSESCWKISNPSGPSDYFNNDYDTACAGGQILAIAAMYCETKSGGASNLIGFFYDNLGVDGTGTTPDLSNAATSLANPTGLPGTFCTDLVGYDVPDVTIASSGHTVAGLAAGDSALWLCADTTSAANKSYFSTDGYSTPAVPFTVNWMLFPAGPITAGQLTVNGGSSTTITELDPVTFTLVGNAGISGEAWMLFVSDGIGNPVIAALPFVFFTVSGSSSVSGTYPCNVFTGGPVPFVAIWLDLVDTKPNGKGKIKVSNQVDMTITPNDIGCGNMFFDWGQLDDGILDANIWKVQNPAGSGDWFNVRHGPAINASGAPITTITGIECASWDFCGTGPNWQSVGIYPADLGFDATGGTPATGSPISTVSGTAASMGPNQSDWGYPATFYDIPDVGASTTTDYHAAVKWNTNDSCVWIGSDTDGTDAGGLGALPSTASYFTSDGYSTAAVQSTNYNAMIKINWN